MKNTIVGIMIGIIISGLAARAALVTYYDAPRAVIIKEVPAPAKSISLDSVIRLYGPEGHATKEYTGAFKNIEQSQGSIKFTLENGRTVILGGSFSVEEIPHQTGI